MKKPSFKTIQIIYASLIIGVIAFFAFTVDTIPIKNFEYDDHTIFTLIVPIFFIIGVFLSHFLFQKSITKIKPADSLFSKLTQYQTANIMRGAPLEGIGFIAIVATSTTANYYYLIYGLLAILLMLVFFPTKNKFLNLIHLDATDIAKLNDM